MQHARLLRKDSAQFFLPSANASAYTSPSAGPGTNVSAYTSPFAGPGSQPLLKTSACLNPHPQRPPAQMIHDCTLGAWPASSAKPPLLEPCVDWFHSDSDGLWKA